MADLTLKIMDRDGKVLCREQGGDQVSLVRIGEYQEGDRIVLYTRADFPHDNWWKQVTLRFSDGSEMVCELEKSSRPHSISFERKVITSVQLCELIKSEDPSPFPALSQIEVYGKVVQR